MSAAEAGPRWLTPAALTSGWTDRPPGCLPAWRPSARPGLWGGTSEVAKGPGWDELQKNTDMTATHKQRFVVADASSGGISDLDSWQHPKALISFSSME